MQQQSKISTAGDKNKIRTKLPYLAMERKRAEKVAQQGRNRVRRCFHGKGNCTGERMNAAFKTLSQTLKFKKRLPQGRSTISRIKLFESAWQALRGITGERKKEHQPTIARNEHEANTFLKKPLPKKLKKNFVEFWTERHASSSQKKKASTQDTQKRAKKKKQWRAGGKQRQRKQREGTPLVTGETSDGPKGRSVS